MEGETEADGSSNFVRLKLSDESSRNGKGDIYEYMIELTWKRLVIVLLN